MRVQVAIIGSGPAAFYAADQILRTQDLTAQVDMIERLPTPYGLVRGGVAPDHLKIKSVIAMYEKTAALPGFRFFGNVEYGPHLTLDDLRTHFDAILFATGAPTDRRMGIPGRDRKRPPESHPVTFAHSHLAAGLDAAGI